MFKLIALISLSLCCSFSFAARPEPTAEQIRKMATDYYLNQAWQKNFMMAEASGFRGNHCEDQDGPSCVETLCKSTNCYGSTGKEIAEACRGANGRCVETLCKSTNCYGSTGKEIAQACRRSSGLCVEVLCESTNCYGSTGKEIAQACEGSDGNCVRELCKSTNCYGSTGKEIAKSCAGN